MVSLDTSLQHQVVTATQWNISKYLLLPKVQVNFTGVSTASTAIVLLLCIMYYLFNNLLIIAESLNCNTIGTLCHVYRFVS